MVNKQAVLLAAVMLLAGFGSADAQGRLVGEVATRAASGLGSAILRRGAEEATSFFVRRQLEQTFGTSTPTPAPAGTPQSQWAAACMTRAGYCPLAAPAVAGSSCGCVHVYFGPIPGVAVP
jgi:hypothetical protein